MMPRVYKRSATIQMRNGLATSTEVKLDNYLKFGMSKLVQANSADAGNLVMVSTSERFVDPLVQVLILGKSQGTNSALK
jgi:hypothetical protein